jgi:prepilin-type N-terminal cleavage/methylation domain-containing protein
MLNRRGFTLVEVVIVLAIASLLFGVVFMAVAGAQKARRDDTRKHDLDRLAGQLEVYASNNEGRYPLANGNPSDGFTGAFENEYLPSNFQDPLAGATYDLNATVAPACNHNANMNANGPGSIGYAVPGNGHAFRLRMCLEQGEYNIGN